jgi:hypothetical protein
VDPVSMSDNNSYSFDPSFFLKLVNDNDNEAANNTEEDLIFSNGNGKVQEISDEDLLVKFPLLAFIFTIMFVD